MTKKEIDAEVDLIWCKCERCGIGLHKDEVCRLNGKPHCQECYDFELNKSIENIKDE